MGVDRKEFQELTAEDFNVKTTGFVFKLSYLGASRPLLTDVTSLNLCFVVA